MVTGRNRLTRQSGHGDVVYAMHMLLVLVWLFIAGIRAARRQLTLIGLLVFVIGHTWFGLRYRDGWRW